MKKKINQENNSKQNKTKQIAIKRMMIKFKNKLKKSNDQG
jgi:hypothetical protein